MWVTEVSNSGGGIALEAVKSFIFYNLEHWICMLTMIGLVVNKSMEANQIRHGPHYEKKSEPKYLQEIMYYLITEFSTHSR